MFVNFEDVQVVFSLDELFDGAVMGGDGYHAGQVLEAPLAVHPDLTVFIWSVSRFRYCCHLPCPGRRGHGQSWKRRETCLGHGSDKSKSRLAALKSLFLIGGAHYTQFVKTLKAISTTKRLLSVPHNSGLLSPKKFCTYMIIHKFKDKIETFSTVIKKGPRIKDAYCSSHWVEDFWRNEICLQPNLSIKSLLE